MALLSSLLPLILLASSSSFVHAISPVQVLAVWPRGSPLPSLSPPSLSEAIEEYASEQPPATRFQTRIVTLTEDTALWGGTQIDPLYIPSFHLGWSRRRWVKDLVNADEYEEVWRREVIIGLPVVLIAISLLALTAVVAIEIHQRRRSDKYYYVME